MALCVVNEFHICNVFHVFHVIRDFHVFQAILYVSRVFENSATDVNRMVWSTWSVTRSSRVLHRISSGEHIISHLTQSGLINSVGAFPGPKKFQERASYVK